MRMKTEKKNMEVSKAESNKLSFDDLDMVSGGTSDDADKDRLEMNTSNRPDNKNESVNAINGKKQKIS